MNLICVVRCEDCGNQPVLDPNLITIFKLWEDYTAMTLCIYCERPIYADIAKSLSKTLFNKQVKILDWMEE